MVAVDVTGLMVFVGVADGTVGVGLAIWIISNVLVGSISIVLVGLISVACSALPVSGMMTVGITTAASRVGVTRRVDVTVGVADSLLHRLGNSRKYARPAAIKITIPEIVIHSLLACE